MKTRRQGSWCRDAAAAVVDLERRVMAHLFADAMVKAREAPKS